MKKNTLCNTKKYKNQAGMNLTPPSPSQNSHAVRWHYYYYYFFDPGSKFPGNEKNYAMQYKKVQKSSWNEPYSSSSFTKQSCSKMALYR